MNRSVRFIRFHAKDYSIDPDRIGITGGSAGGHLSLMQGTAGDDGDPKAQDPVDRVSSRVQCVACFFPPTDFLNWGEKGKEMINRNFRPPYTAAFDYHEFDKEKALYIPITDEKQAPRDQRRRFTDHARRQGRPADPHHARRQGRPGAVAAVAGVRGQAARKSASRRS